MTGNDSSNSRFAIARAAERIRFAGTMHRTVPPVRDLIAVEDLDSAYEVQRQVAALQEASGARVIGRKLGLVSPEVQDQLGVHQATIGTLMDVNRIIHDGTVRISQLIQPLVEAEVAFRLSRDLDDEDIGIDEASSAVEEVFAAIEIVDSRIERWNIAAVDTIADNASAGLFVISNAGLPIEGLDLLHAKMELFRNGFRVSNGAGTDNAMGDPIRGLAWLAREACRQGIPLQAGQIVLAGALGPMTPLEEGDSYVATIGDLPEVKVKIRSSVAARGAETR